jgi:ABC-type phosphate/phosphonate transport system substrate-binding protein
MTNSGYGQPCGFLHKVCAVVLMLVVGCFCCGAGRPRASNFHLRMGYVGDVYPDMDNRDVNAAVSVLARRIVWEKIGKGEARYYDSIWEMERDFRDRKVQVLAMPIEAFMELRNRLPIEPMLVSTTDRGHDTELLLLVRKDSGLHSMHDLKKRTIVMPERNRQFSDIFHIWLETLVMREGGLGIDTFFSSVKEMQTVSKVVMPVFFRQADACVVSRQVFDLTSELNPQIGRELTAIARIDRLAHGVVAFDAKLPEEIKRKFLQAFLSLHETPDGEQLLMLFQVRKLIQFQPEYLKATEALFTEYRDRRAKIAHKLFGSKS